PLSERALEAVRAMGRRLAHRGPDAEGFWAERGRRVAFAHRRLSVIDLSEAANQPMLGGAGETAVCFNGEIYNHAELRERRERESGVRFRTASDTEVLCRPPEPLDSEAAARRLLEPLAGMFAFALW